MTDDTDGCYLLCFAEPFKHARHYIGWAKHIATRVGAHRKGTSGARLPAAVHRAGIEMRLARTWPGRDRHYEKRLTAMGSAARFCPLCRQEGRFSGFPSRKLKAALSRPRDDR